MIQNLPFTETDAVVRPVWDIVFDQPPGTVSLKPCEEPLPVSSLENRLVVTHVHLNNGREILATISNVNVADPRFTAHFLTISLFNDGEWFLLARYHDPNWSTDGPEALAEFFGFSMQEVFPIAYDLTSVASGNSRVLASVIPSEPAERLNRAEISRMAVP